MYCVKVFPETERARVRGFNNGFLPSYQAVDAKGKRIGKKLVVPGYVFILQPTMDSVIVPDKDEELIEVLSDPHDTTVNAETGEIIDGPLKAIEQYITERTAGSVQITAEILGERRQYRVQVLTEAEAEEKRIAAMEEEARAKAEAEMKMKAQNEKRKAQKRKYTFTEEQQAEMLARAAEIGVHAAAKEFSVPWQSLAYLRIREEEKDGTKKAAREASGNRKTPKKTAAKAAESSEYDKLKAENQRLHALVAEMEAKNAKLKKAIRELL